MPNLPDQPDQLDRLLAALDTRGILLRAEGSRLHIDAPAGSFTPDLQAKVQRQRDQIIRQLAVEQADDGPQSIRPNLAHDLTGCCFGGICFAAGDVLLAIRPRKPDDLRLTPRGSIRRQTTSTNLTEDTCCNVNVSDDGDEHIAVKCDHLNPATWPHRNGKAYCRGCDKYMGRVVP